MYKRKAFYFSPNFSGPAVFKGELFPYRKEWVVLWLEKVCCFISIYQDVWKYITHVIKRSIHVLNLYVLDPAFYGVCLIFPHLILFNPIYRTILPPQ